MNGTRIAVVSAALVAAGACAAWWWARHAGPPTRIDALTSLRDLVSVTVESKGCFGPCGIYTLTYAKDDRATLVWRRPTWITVRGKPYTPRARAEASWGVVVGLLHRAHVERLDAMYPIRGEDWPAATFSFRFPRRTYTVDGPDSTSWPPQFWATFLSLRTFAAKQRWSPPLAPFQIETLRPRFRRNDRHRYHAVPDRTGTAWSRHVRLSP